MTYQELRDLLDTLSDVELQENIKIWDPNNNDWCFCSLVKNPQRGACARDLLYRGRAIGDVVLDINWEG